MDSGKIIAQEAFHVGNMNHDEIETQIHKIEHGLYPRTLAKLIEEMKA